MTIKSLYPNVSPSLNLDFAKTKVLDPRITFTRASSASFINVASQRVTAASDAPRFTHNPLTGESLGLLVEEARTNIFLNTSTPADQRVTLSDNTAHSLSLSGTGTLSVLTASSTVTGSDLITNGSFDTGLTGWTTEADATATVTAGVLNVTNSSPNVGVYQTITTTPNKFYQIVVRSRRVSAGTYADVWYDSTRVFGMENSGVGFSFRTGYFYATTSSTVIYLRGRAVGEYEYDSITVFEVVPSTVASLTGSGAYPIRNAFTFTTPVSNVDANRYLVTVSGTIDNPQVEAGDCATSFIQTAGSTVTRAADVLSITGTNFSTWYRPDEGTVFSAIRPATTTNTCAWSLSDGTANEVISSFTGFTSNFSVTDGGSSQVAINFGAYGLNVLTKAANTYKVNRFNYSQNGSLATADTTGTVPTVNSLYIMSLNGISNVQSGTISRLAYYPISMSDTQLSAITAA